MDDDAVRLLAMGLFGVGLLLLFVGGATTRIGGAWRDGDRMLVLRQLGFYLRGHAEVAGGLQVYRGYTLFGRVRLWRNDYGARHLQNLGFDARQVARLEGQVTGLFRLHWSAAAPDELAGTFSGKRFAFEGRELRSSSYVQPQPRRWSRSR